MNRFHSQKVIEATDGLEKGRLNSKRRQTILRENYIFGILMFGILTHIGNILGFSPSVIHGNKIQK